MKNKCNRGFTLIEILAVIAILSIIILIAVNVITSRVRDANKNAVKVNANNYIKAINSKAALSQNIGEDMESGFYLVSILNGLEDINISGKKPSSGFAYLSNYEVTNACLTYGEYSAIIVNGKTSSVESGDCDNVQEIFDGVAFEYTGSEQFFVVPMNGKYTIEVWGAQGGSYNDTYMGGYGSYSKGEIELDENDVLYINVGGKGVSAPVSQTELGGYNGGGNSYTILSSCSNSCSSGGGASSVSLDSGLLKNQSLSNVVIVAAGGGGASYRYCSGNDYTYSSGGSGGGYLGSFPQIISSWGSTISSQASQTAGGSGGTSNNESGAAAGSFGHGGQTSRTGGYTCGTGGGGGLYGGGNGMFIGGSGGSSYIGNSKLSNKVMYCYNCATSNEVATKTVSVTCASETPTANCAKKGSGYVKITYSGASSNTNKTEKNIALDFGYTGSEQSYKITKAGKYKIQAWGASGAGYDSTYQGGYGGYSEGIINLSKGDTLYVNVGGAGSYIGPNNIVAGGYNGGGAVTATWGDGNEKRASGGGATSVATSSGLLSTLESKKESVILVAGGGGAAQVNSAILNQAWGHGGSGGGYIGGSGSGISYNDVYSTTGGTQTSGGTSNNNEGVGSFGMAGVSSTGNASGGGGGWYGGAPNLRGASGGSGYIGNNKLTSKLMYCYNCQESSDANTKTISTTCVSEIPTNNCAKIGNGHVKISLIK